MELTRIEKSNLVNRSITTSSRALVFFTRWYHTYRVVYPWLWSNIYCWPRLLDLQDMRNVTQLLLQSIFFWKEQPNNFFLIHFAMEAPAWKFSDSSSGCVLFVFIRSVVSGVYLFFIKYCFLILRKSKSSEGKLKT